MEKILEDGHIPIEGVVEPRHLFTIEQVCLNLFTIGPIDFGVN